MLTIMVDAFAKIAPVLAAARDDEIVAALVPLGEGIGGPTALLDVDGTTVFVKRVPLTATEAAAPHDTANLFGLPGFYQYGVGSAGFSAWRELTAHRITTAWRRSGRIEGFPLLYHWRLLPRTPTEPVDVDERVAYWDGSAAVRRRLTELHAATRAVTLFLEHIPHALGPWLTERVEECGWVARDLAATVRAMNDAGLWHFDAHMGNLLTDGRRVYVTDFGLATHRSFTHTAAEAAFLRAHADFDRRFTAGHLATWLAFTLGTPGRWADWPDGLRLMEEVADTGTLPEALRAAPVPARDIILEQARDARRLNDFFTALVTGSKRTPYPAAPQINKPAVR